MGTILPFPKHQFFTNAGAPASSHVLHTFLAGTTTQTPTYSNQALTVANANPVVLDSAGRATLFGVPGISLKLELALSTDTTPPASPLWSVDNVNVVPPGSTSADVDVSGTAGETIAAGNCCYLSDGSGGTTAGRWYLVDADAVGSSTAAQKIGFATAAISTGASGTIRTEGRVTGLTGLVAGTWYYASATAGALTSSAPANARIVAQADSTTSAIVVNSIPTASATVSGLITTGTQTIAGAKTFSGAATFSSTALFSGRVKVTPWKPLADDFTDHATSGTGATNVWSVSVPGGTVQDGETLVLEAFGDLTGDTNTKTFAVQLGATAISMAGTAVNFTSWRLTLQIVRVSASVQRVFLSGHMSGVVVDDIYAEWTENLGNTLTLKITLTHATSGTTTQRTVRTWIEPAA